MSRARPTFLRSVLLGLGLVGLLAGGGWVLHEQVLGGPAPTHREPPVAPSAEAPRPAAPRPEVLAVVVMDVVGNVERGGGGQWHPLRAGDRVMQPAAFRASVGARARLQVGDERSQLTLQEGTEVEVREVTRQRHALRLRRGRVSVDYHPEGQRLLRLETEGGAVAETRGARFTVLRSGVAVAVATEAGAVNLVASGGSVLVEAGAQAVALDGETPSMPVPISREVLLQVARRAGAAAACATLEGRVRPGSEVWVEGAPAEVSREGHFLVRVARRPGRRGVRVEAREAGGGVRERLVDCSPREEAPRGKDPDATVKFDWNHEP